MIASITNMAASSSLGMTVVSIFSHVVMCWSRVTAPLIGGLGTDNGFSLELLMPGVTPSQNDQYMCTAKKLDSKEAFIMSFQPQGTNENAHHMLLFGCKEDNPKAALDSWECSLSKEVCRNGLKILYAWTKNAHATHLPKDVGVRVGGSSDINYLVLQVHYAHPFAGPKDYTGFNLHLSHQRPKYIAGIYLLMANNAEIPANSVKFHTDSACKFSSALPIYPFAYRVHTHSLGVVVSAYKRSTDGRWTLLGKGNPQWPQAFYPMDQISQVQNNDILSARCTYNSMGRERTTFIGHRTIDEMCNFYIMYYTDAANGSPFFECSDVNIRSDLLSTLPTGNDVPLPQNPALEEHVLKEVENWPSSDVPLGQVSGVALDSKGNVHIFHRGNRVWNSMTFDLQHHFKAVEDGPIKTDTIVVYDKNSGSVLKKWGSNLFYLPHGIALDKDDNVYVTDVGTHQVFKFAAGGGTTPLLTLGEKLILGADENHFCKPAGVAVTSRGEIFVADGYCNSRIVKFSPEGKFLMQWGKSSLTIDKVDNFPQPSTFSIPHSLALAEDKDLLCVADRENGRIQCFSLNGTFHCQIHLPHFGSQLFAVSYSPTLGGSLYAINGNFYADPSVKVQGFVININNQALTATFGPSKTDFVHPHDLQVSPDGSLVYVVEIGPNKVWKLKQDNVISISEKKSMPSDPAIQQSKPGNAVDTISEIKKTVAGESSIKDDEEPNFGASMIIMALLAIPLLLMIIVTVFVRLHKQGKFKTCNFSHFKGWMLGYKTQTPNKFNLGTFLNRHKGFDKVSTEESDHDPEDLSDSDVEEYSAASVQKA